MMRCLVMALSLVLLPACGEKGRSGSAGTNGVNGVNGETGANGLQGPRGDQGALGIGIRGDKGEAGARGERGPSGGEKGDPGEPGPQGLQGEAGLQGFQGSEGVNGKDGVDGNNCEMTLEGEGNPQIRVFTCDDEQRFEMPSPSFRWCHKEWSNNRWQYVEITGGIELMWKHHPNFCNEDKIIGLNGVTGC